MHVRAKFNISKITMQPGNSGGHVTMQAVSRGTRNADWSAATPSGTIEMFISNPKAFEQFRLMLEQNQATGRYPELYVDFTPAEDGWVGDGHKFVADESVAEGHYTYGQCAECGTENNERNHPNG